MPRRRRIRERHEAGDDRLGVHVLRWYCRYSLSYRNLEEMMGERGLSVDHTTVSGCAGKPVAGKFHVAGLAGKKVVNWAGV